MHASDPNSCSETTEHMGTMYTLTHGAIMLLNRDIVRFEPEYDHPNSDPK
jgi:hypothetical protein